MICNYTICCWPTTFSNILIVDHNSVKGGLKVIDHIVLSDEYWGVFHKDLSALRIMLKSQVARGL